MGVKDGTAGGEVLDYVGKSKESYDMMDEGLIQQLGMVPLIKVLIVILIVAALIYAIALLAGRYAVLNRKKGITRTIEHVKGVKKSDERIQAYNKFIIVVTKIIESTPLKASALNKEYMEYNLTRANIRIPGGYRVMKYEEYNALKAVVKVAFVAISVLFGVFINVPIAVFMCFVTLLLVSMVPDTLMRMTVTNKDAEIEAEFADFYLMLHYVLLTHANIPLVGIIQSYERITDSAEMKRFVDVCVHYIDTYSEYEATKYIASAYKEIPYVGKLMRLIRQANEGGDVDAELRGFRTELLNAKKYAIQRRGDKMIARANASFNILYIVLVQAVISAMLIYVEDLGIMGSIF